MNTNILRQHIAKRRHFTPATPGFRKPGKSSISGLMQIPEKPGSFRLKHTLKGIGGFFNKPVPKPRFSFKDFMKDIHHEADGIASDREGLTLPSPETAKHPQVLPPSKLKSVFSVAAAIILPLLIGMIFFIQSGKTFPTGIRTFRLPEENDASGFLNDLMAFETAPPGNTDEIDLERVPALPLSFSVRSHVVVKGETLDGIAKRYSISQDSIISMNSIKNVRKLAIGSSLKIPNLNGVAYTVKKGDSLARIAKTFSIDSNAILDANNLESTNLSIGKSLFIPGAKLSSVERRRALGELFLWPVGGKLSSYYGYRNSPFSGARQFHNGIDLANDIGTKVTAAMEGKVAAIDYNPVYGNYIIIVHSDGFQTWYAHLNKTLVRTGQAVVQGQKIAEVGNTGISTGSHLHFSIFKRGQALNPLSYLK